MGDIASNEIKINSFENIIKAINNDHSYCKILILSDSSKTAEIKFEAQEDVKSEILTYEIN